MIFYTDRVDYGCLRVFAAWFAKPSCRCMILSIRCLLFPESMYAGRFRPCRGNTIFRPTRPWNRRKKRRQQMTPAQKAIGAEGAPFGPRRAEGRGHGPAGSHPFQHSLERGRLARVGIEIKRIEKIGGGKDCLDTERPPPPLPSG